MTANRGRRPRGHAGTGRASQRLCVWLGLLALSGGCTTRGGSTPSPPADDATFVNPEPVSIEGYDGHAMEPFVARDGSALLFNNLNADTDGGQPNDTDIHVARHLSGGTRFEYVGPIDGASTDHDPARNELEGVPSLDAEGRLYFTSTVHYAADRLATLFVGRLAGTTLTQVAPIGPLKIDGSSAVPGDVNMDAEIAPDGQLLVFTEAFFSGAPVPDRANLGMAERQVDGSFEVLPDSAELMKNVNTANLEYAPCTSADRTELYFSRWVREGPDAGKFFVLVARRASTTAPWSLPSRISAIQGDLVEAPTLSGDGRSLYYHQRVGEEHRIFRVTRAE